MERSLVHVTVTALENQYDPNASTSEAARRALAAAAGNSPAERSASRAGLVPPPPDVRWGRV